MCMVVDRDLSQAGPGPSRAWFGLGSGRAEAGPGSQSILSQCALQYLLSASSAHRHHTHDQVLLKYTTHSMPGGLSQSGQIAAIGPPNQGK